MARKKRGILIPSIAWEHITYHRGRGVWVGTFAFEDGREVEETNSLENRLEYLPDVRANLRHKAEMTVRAQIKKEVA